MDAVAFEQVYGAFQDFHAYFAALFGRRETRDHSRQYLQALLVQFGERRNAEYLSETVPASARAMQRFLTESPWDDDGVMGRLQEYLDPGLDIRRGVGAGRQRLPQAGGEVGGSGSAVLRPAGQGGQLPGRNVPGLRQPAGSGPGGQRALSAGELDRGPRPVPGGRGAGAEAGLPVEDRVGAGAAAAGPGAGPSAGGLGCGDDAFGMSPSFREGLAALGMRYVLDVPAGFTVWPEEPERTSPAYQGRGAPRKPRLKGGQRRTMGERSAELPEAAWREITVAEGSQGPRSYRFSAQRVRPTSRRKPGEIHWAVYRRNLDGSELRYYLSNAPEDTPLETLAYVGGSRWRIETEFETEQSDVGLDEYETRTPQQVRSGLASPRGPLLAGRRLSAESATGLGGKRCPGSRDRRSTGWCVRCCPGNGSGRLSCCDGWRIRRIVTNGPDAPMPSAAPPFGHPHTFPLELSL